MEAAKSTAYTMTDIHMHLIPGVDDGAVDLEMAMAMISRAREQGITTIFATPHSDAFSFGGERTKNQFRMLKAEAARCFPEVGIFPGCEVYCEADRMGRVLDCLARGQYPAMNASAYVLAEFSKWVSKENALTCLEALCAEGWIPIVAHAERYSYLQGDMVLLDRFRALGCKIQINAYSLFNETDASTKSWARRIALEQKADFLGTDAHRTFHRPPMARDGLNWLYENCPGDYADALCRGNVREVLLVSG